MQACDSPFESPAGNVMKWVRQVAVRYICGGSSQLDHTKTACAQAVTYLISRCSVIRLRNLLYFFSSSRADVFFRFCIMSTVLGEPACMILEHVVSVCG